MASGRRTASSWWRAAGVGQDFRSYYYFLDSLGRKAFEVAAALLRIVTERVEAGDRPVFALDDTPTKRYGPEVQGAGIHHNPTPGPAGSKFLYGHSWVTLSRVAHHARRGVIGLPLLGMLYVRRKDIPGLPDEAGVAFRTKLEMAAEAIDWLGPRLPGDATPWVAVDGGYAKREFLKPAMKAGFIVVARLRKDAALCDLPPALRPGQKRGLGRPPIYGKGRPSLAKRAGQTRGWKEDGAYDRAGVYEATSARGAKAVIPPRKDARIKIHGNTKGEPHPRDTNLRAIRRLGRKGWKRESGYHRRSLAETAMGRIKGIFGGVLRSREWLRQGTELGICCRALNIMTHLGMPVSVKLA